MARKTAVKRGFKLGDLDYGQLYGGLTFPLLLRVSSVKTGSETTVFYSDTLNDLGNSIAELENLFNVGFKVKFVSAYAAGNEGVVRDISDTAFEGIGSGGNFQLTLGTAMGNNIVAGDAFLLAPDEFFAGGGWVKGTVAASLADQDLFSITGAVRVHEIIGIVKTVVQSAGCTIKLIFDPDDGGSDVDLDAGTYDANAAAVGTIIRWTGDFSDALIAALDAVEAPGYDAPANGVLMYAGDIKVDFQASRTGVIDWYCRFDPVDGDLVAG